MYIIYMFEYGTNILFRACSLNIMECIYTDTVLLFHISYL